MSPYTSVAISKDVYARFKERIKRSGMKMVRVSNDIFTKWLDDMDKLDELSVAAPSHE